MTKNQKNKCILAVANLPGAAGPRVYTLTVGIMRGRDARAIKAKRGITRTIQIRGEQTLDDLHEAIFAAYDRYDEHMYQFEFGAKPMARAGAKYVHPVAYDAGVEEAHPADEATIDSLKLCLKQRFFYWFDFGDDWWHWIDVNAMSSEIEPGNYPRVIARVGKSPAQYPDVEEDGDEE